MQRPFDGRWSGFFAIATGLVIIGAISIALPATTPSLVLLYAPSVFLLTGVGEFATCALVALLFSRTRWRALFPLAVTFLASGLTLGCVFFSFPLPGSDGLTLPDDVSSPWLLVLWNVILAAGAIWYAVERGREAQLSIAATKRMLRVGLPLAAVITCALLWLIIIAAPAVPHLVNGVDMRPMSKLHVLDILALSLGLALVVLVRLILRRTVHRIDLAVTLSVLAALIGIIVLYPIDARFEVGWMVARLLNAFSSCIVLVAVIRHLIEGVSEGVRIEADALRARASELKQNVEVEASLVKSRFVAAVSHELRTPLGGILGMAELLDRTSLTERQRFCTNAISSSADTLMRVVNDLLDFSRAESGQLDLEDIPFELGQTIENVAVLFREQARKNDVALHVFIDPALPGSLCGDPTRLKQVLQNLLNNAVRFTQTGSIRVEVVPDLSIADAPMVRFSVHDTGIGIARSAQERVFNAFTQEDASTARRFGGTGLGLAIARHLVELMGGRLTLRSVVGVGSTFTFTMPLRTIAMPDDDEAMPLSGMRILVVDRDPIIRTLLHRYVTGWEMRAVSTAPDDVEAAIAGGKGDGAPFAVLLVGPSMPAAEATAFARALRGRPILTGADCIYIASDHMREEACPDGFDTSVSGPLRQSTLFDAILRLRRDGVIERVAPAIDGVAPRRPRRERILIAEDNEINQALLVAQLEHLGFGADVVADGEAAVQAVSARSYDLIFMDCQMPVVDGFEAARRIRRLPGGQSIPIVAVTANVLPGYRDVCVAAGMNDYLAKPALIDPLTVIVDEWLPLEHATPVGVARAIPAPPPAPSRPRLDIRQRLREIFRGDDERVEATIALATTSLREGAQTIATLIADHDADAAAGLAHKLKGIALEVGFVGITDLARTLETHIKAHDWAAASALQPLFAEAISVEASAGEEVAT